MTDALWSRLADLVPDALALPPAERAAFLDRACTGADGTADPALRREAVALVAAADAADLAGALVSPVAPLAAGAGPAQVGPWRVTGRMGEGGMGTVYRATRADASFTQHAAVKLAHPSAAPDFRARFVRERALLAGLDHPGIARLLDGGVATDGAPYLAMELVEGEPITRYAEIHTLGVEDRLGLFVQACEAVAHAHRALVVHRDLKPAHILVTEPAPAQAGGGANRKPRVKLLDFGIARLLSDDGADALLTRTGPGPMTPAYAAPEQLLGRPVTTATDVYALGVVLYELLAGRRPYDLTSKTASEVERIVAEAEPPRPSAVAPPERARQLRGDLDTIVARAMAKEPARRYAGAEALADDLRRHLGGLPVEARPATAGYRAGRFVRRHRAGVAAAAAVVVGAVALVGFYTVRLKSERDRAQAATRVAQAETVRAEAEAERAEAVAGFLEGIIRAPNARWYVDAEAKGPDTPIRAVLDEASVRVDRDFADRPDLLADLHHLLGDTYGALELYDEAGRHHLRVLALRESLYTPPHPKIAEALYYAASYASRGDLPATVRVLERAVAMQRVRNEGNNFPFMIEALTKHYQSAGRYAEATVLLDEGLAFAAARFVPGHDGYRYRDRILVSLAQSRALAGMSLGDIDGATRSLALSDSVLARLPRVAGHHDAWRNQACARGRLDRLQRRPAAAERLLRACWGEGPPRAPGSPFPGAEALSASRRRRFRETASADLVALYEASGRPADAAPYRADAARYRAQQDSVRATFLENAD